MTNLSVDHAGTLPTLSRRVGQQLARTAVILLAALLVTGATILLASGPFGSSTASAGGPPVGRPVSTASVAPSAGTEQAVSGEQAASVAAAVPSRPAGADGRTAGGRNTPSLTRGMPKMLAEAAIMAIVTTLVVLVLHGRTTMQRRARRA